MNPDERWTNILNDLYSAAYVVERLGPKIIDGSMRQYPANRILSEALSVSQLQTGP